MSYEAVVCSIKTSSIEGLDNLLLGITPNGNRILVGKNSNYAGLGLYFEPNTQLSDLFCEKNKLYKSLGGYIESNRRVKIIRLRKIESEGLWLPLSCLSFLGDINEVDFTPGTFINTYKGHKFCDRYEVPNKTLYTQSGGKKKKKIGLFETVVKYYYPYFEEHTSTENIRKFFDKLPDLVRDHQIDKVYITEKLHGTSGRSTKTLVEKTTSTFWNRLFRRGPKEEKLYKSMYGSRRVVFDPNKPPRDDYRLMVHNSFPAHIRMGYTFYYEIVGYCNNNTPIMPSISLTNLKDPLTKKFNEKFGNNMTYSYGCRPGEFDFYVYRITYHDFGKTFIEHNYNAIQQICKDLNIKPVPLLSLFIINSPDDINKLKDFLLAIEQHNDDFSLVTAQRPHCLEGLCIRLESSTTNYTKVFKYKFNNFLYFEGIQIDSGIVDEEEVQNVVTE